MESEKNESIPNSFQTPTNPSGLAPWANPYAELSAVTPENARASDQPDISPWSADPEFDIFRPYSQLPDLGYPLASDTNVSRWIEYTENLRPSTGDSPAIDLQHHSHFGIDAPSELQRPASDTDVSRWMEYTENPRSFTGDSPAIDLQHHSHIGIDASSELQRPASDTNVSHWIEYTKNPRSSTGDSPAIDLQHHSHPDIDASSEPQRHTLQTQRDASSAHPSINDSTHFPALNTVVKDVVDTQEPGSPTGSSSSIEFLYIGYSGIGTSQQHTPQTSGNPLSPYSPSPGIASTIPGIEVQPQQQRTYQRQRNVSSQYQAELTRGPTQDGEVSYNLIETQRQGSSTSSRSVPDIRYFPAVGSSLQPQRHALQSEQMFRSIRTSLNFRYLCQTQMSPGM